MVQQMSRVWISIHLRAQTNGHGTFCVPVIRADLLFALAEGRMAFVIALAAIAMRDVWPASIGADTCLTCLGLTLFVPPFLSVRRPRHAGADLERTAPAAADLVNVMRGRLVLVRVEAGRDDARSWGSR